MSRGLTYCQPYSTSVSTLCPRHPESQRFLFLPFHGFVANEALDLLLNIRGALAVTILLCDSKHVDEGSKSSKLACFLSRSLPHFDRRVRAVGVGGLIDDDAIYLVMDLR